MGDPEDRAREDPPPHDTEAVLDEAAHAVADAAAIDWDAHVAGSPDAASRLAKLELIDRLARAFRDVGARGPGTSAARAADETAGLGTWSHLRLLSKLGEGSFGEVYRAYDPLLDTFVALKLSKLPGAGDERRYLEEARRLARVRHPNVVVVHGAEVHDGRVGLWTDLVDGEDLEQLLAREGPIGARAAARIGADVCRALTAVHAQGLVHGDVKASNVMRDREGRVLLMDFGTVKEVAPDGRDVIVTRGTPLVLAPELLRGQPPTPASDLYSVGVLVYQLLTARHPVEGKTLAEVARRHEAGEATTLRERRRRLPAALLQAVERALDPDPRRRPASAADLEAALSAAAGGRRHAASEWTIVTASLLGVVVAIGAVLQARHGAPGRPSRTSVAVLAFKDLSGRADTAWLSTALSEMLATELSAGGRLRVVPGAEVERAKLELGLRNGDVPAAGTLRRLRRNLGADFIALGSFVALGDEGGGLRVDVRLVDTGGGDSVLAVSEQAGGSELFDLVARIGARLRARLGSSSAPPGLSRSSLPGDPQASRWYAEGLARLRAFDARQARLLLEKAVAAQPGFAPAHSALASAWAALGDEVRAREAARRAFELSGALAREDALLVEARYREYAREWDQAVVLYRSLAASIPDDVEPGLALARVQTSAGRGKEALATIEALRRAPGAAEDPRLDLEEAKAADAIASDRRSQAAAARAADKAGASGARSVVARARLQEGVSWGKLGEPQPAMACIEEARGLFADLGDTWGAASALLQQGNLLRERGELSRARGLLEHALALCREIGHLSGAAAAFTDIGLVVRQQGDLAGAQSMFEQALAIHRERRDLRAEAGALNNIAMVHRQRGLLEAAITSYEQALDLYLRVGDTRGRARQLNNIANVLMMEGDLARARRLYEESLDLARDLGDRRGVAILLHNLGELRLQLGEPVAARAHLEEALAVRRATGDRSRTALTLEALARVMIARADLAGAHQALDEAAAIRNEIHDVVGPDARVLMAELALEEGRPQDGLAALNAAVQDLEEQKRPDDEAAARFALARAAAAAGDPAAASAAMTRAVALSSRSESAVARFLASFEPARLKASGPRSSCADLSGDARRVLQAAARRAASAGWITLELEARLALGQAEAACGRAGSARTGLAAVGKAARERGLLLLASHAEAHAPTGRP